MVQSMTGYGKSECIAGSNKIVVEIRSVNGKGSEISLKTQIIPREKEIEIKQMIASELKRGTIDLFASSENIAEPEGRQICYSVFNSYFNQIEQILSLKGMKMDTSLIVQAVLRLPDVIENHKRSNEESLIEENWDIIKESIEEAIKQLKEFRIAEGEKLQEDIIARVNLILKYLDEVLIYEEERVSGIKERIRSRFDELLKEVDPGRFEQEMIYYLERLDITEERVRLRQHCNYFLQTLTEEEYPGKKLGFISQEMGREINTLGSKSNHTTIQKIVVQMKDELEKIKEQILNLA